MKRARIRESNMSSRDTLPARGSRKGFEESDVGALWERYRSGESVACPRDGGNLALSIDGAAQIYRFVCNRCGTASPWFGMTRIGLVVQERMATMPPPGATEDD